MSRPIIFGEILFDCFPDGSRVCSGAPLNVCRNLKYLGHEPLMISRVGTDGLGALALETLAGIGLDLSGVQRDPEHPTCQATVSITDHEPSYHFTPDSAWDHISATDARAACAGVTASFLYTGTLALRSPISLQALHSLFDAIDAPLFFDANLRTPWWTRELVDDLLARATWLKCNAEEYALLFGDADPGRIREQYDLEVLLVTRGAQGAALYFPSGSVADLPPPLEGPLVDTVGAGDAFAAAVIDGLLRHQEPSAILAAGLQLSAKVCCRRGADWD